LEIQGRRFQEHSL